MSVPDELRLVVREVLEQQCGQVTIFTKVQQVLHVQGVDAILRVVVDDLVADEQGLVGIRGAETVERETTGQTSDGAEQTFESLGHVVRNEVLVDLHHRDDRLLSVRQLSFTADTEELLVMNHPKRALSVLYWVLAHSLDLLSSFWATLNVDMIDMHPCMAFWAVSA